MTLVAGVDVGASGVKIAVLKVENPLAYGNEVRAEILGLQADKFRRRVPATVAEENYHHLLEEIGVEAREIDYVATTGDGEGIPFGTGHFYGMTTHARGGLFLVPEATSVLDAGALHARAILMDERGKVLGHRMTSQCASGSGQFLENISRYLGVTLEEVGELSLSAETPEMVSGVCAVLAETDVINMVSRGITKADIIKGIHLSIGNRLVKLLGVIKAKGTTAITGGLAADTGLMQAIREQLERVKNPLQVVSHPRAIYAGALGAALWGAFRHEKLARRRTGSGRTARREGVSPS
jgi:benzoyl-CoA reductase subunit D